MKRKVSILGFTLLELMIGIVIVGILASISIKLYTKHIKRARRMVAIQTLLSIQLAEEQYRSTNTQYGTLAQVWGGVNTTTGGYYSLSITNTSATNYTITATALTTQTSDKENSTTCTPLVLTMSSGTETKTPAACWLN